ncbi:unnamed protein product [Clonostachys rosea]|uniref:Uncharacterized protein n=1 Tax=Bionectria ochroleuca TaxID=29856 RepID=A0ABY6U3J4_BIOOC|nr:unnamed protein product [Clonostachys rosea]
MTVHMVEPCSGTVGSGGENIAMPLLEGLAKAANGAIFTIPPHATCIILPYWAKNNGTQSENYSREVDINDAHRSATMAKQYMLSGIYALDYELPTLGTRDSSSSRITLRVHLSACEFPSVAFW